MQRANLSGADLRRAALGGANLHKADLRGAQLVDAWLVQADLTQAKLHGANLRGAMLYEADFTGAKLSNASFHEADLREANLTGADLTETHLHYARLIRTKLRGANLSNCSVYGISAWDLEVDKDTKQSDLIITDHNQTRITVESLEVAQFIYLLLHNEKIRHVIDTITSKTVLILGRFKPKRKAILDALREELRNRDYLPILFDFDGPKSRTTLETVTTLAHMARFVIADISDAKSILQELTHIVPHIPTLPVQPVIAVSQEEPGMFDFFKRFPWFLPVYRYTDLDELLASLQAKVIAPAEARRASG